MITVTGPLWLWSVETGSWHFITVPDDQSGEVRAHSLLSRGGFGSVKVEATIHDRPAASGQAVTWRTSIFPIKAGGYILPVKKEVRCRAGIAAGDEVTVTLELL
jgi:hypothetical protein